MADFEMNEDMDAVPDAVVTNAVGAMESMDDITMTLVPGTDEDVATEYARIDSEDDDEQLTQEEFEALVAEAEREEWLGELTPFTYSQKSEQGRTKKPYEPVITTLYDHFKRYDQRNVFQTLTEMLWNREICLESDVDEFYREEPDQPRWRAVPDFQVWRVSREEFIFDVKVILQIGVMRDGYYCGTETYELYVSLPYEVDDNNYLCLFDGEVSISKPERDLCPMDGWGIPIYKLHDIGKWAEDLWRERMKLTEKSDFRAYSAYKLAKMQGLDVIRRYLGDKEPRAVLFWEETEITTYVDEKEEPETIKAHTIVLNESVLNGLGGTKETLHEIYHDDNHYIFFRTQEMCNDDLRKIKKRDHPRNAAKPMKNRLPILEWQAKMGALALWMPGSLLRQRIEQVKKEERAMTNHWGVVFETTAFRLSHELCIPAYLIRQRMLQLGYWQARGSLNWIRGSLANGLTFGEEYEHDHYIAPFMFEKESCPTSKYTFFIDPDGFRILWQENKEFAKRIENGSYVYVNGLVCVQDPLCIEKTEYGLRLTAWANHHVNLCCLRFINHYVIDESGYRFKRECVYCDEEYNQHYLEWIPKSAEKTKEEVNRARAKFIASLPDTPGGMLKVLMKWNGWVRTEQMAERAMVSVSTVKNWRNEKECFTKENAIRIIVALHLPPWIQTRFLEIAQVKLGYTEYDMALREIMDCFFMDDMWKVNEVLTAYGFTPFKEAA